MIAKNLPAGWAALSVPLAMLGGMAGKLACGLLAERVGIIRTIVVTEIATASASSRCWWYPTSPRTCCCL